MSYRRVNTQLVDLPLPETTPLVWTMIPREWITLLRDFVLRIELDKLYEGTDDGTMSEKITEVIEALEETIMNCVQMQVTETAIEYKCGDETEWTHLINLSELQGADGTDGKQIELGVNSGFIQWRYIGETWENLIALSELQGADGADGADGTDGIDGADGQPVELGVSSNLLRWKYANEDNSAWRNIFDLSSLQGADGADGENAPIPVFEFDGTVLKIDVDGDGDFEVTSPNLKGDTGATGDCDCDDLRSPYYLPPFPQANEADIYCYAANIIVGKYTDTVGDMLELIDAAENISAETIEGLMEAVNDVLPIILDVANAIVGFVHEGLNQTALDWARANVGDAQANAVAREIFYCAIKKAHEQNDLENLASYLLVEIPSQLVFDWVKLSVNTIQINNLGDVVESVFDTLDGSFMGYVIVSYAVVSDAFLGSLGLVQSINAMYSFAAQNAQFFDARDCSGFGCYDGTCTNYLISSNIASTSGSEQAPYYISNMFDQDYTEPHRWTDGVNQGTHFATFELGTAQVLRRWRVICFPWLLAEAPRDFRLNGSMNGTDWTQLGQFSGVSYIHDSADFDYFDCTVQPSQAYLYYQIVITETNSGYCSIAELEACLQS